MQPAGDPGIGAGFQATSGLKSAADQLRRLAQPADGLDRIEDGRASCTTRRTSTRALRAGVRQRAISLGTTFLAAYTRRPGRRIQHGQGTQFQGVAERAASITYGTLAFELSGQADGGGSNEGTYLELGAGPAFPLKASGPDADHPHQSSVSALSDYYESGGEDHKKKVHGTSSTSAPRSPSRSRACRAITGPGTSTAAWTSSRSAIPPKALNDDSSSKVVGLIGIGVRLLTAQQGFRSRLGRRRMSAELVPNAFRCGWMREASRAGPSAPGGACTEALPAELTDYHSPSRAGVHRQSAVGRLPHVLSGTALRDPATTSEVDRCARSLARRRSRSSGISSKRLSGNELEVFIGASILTAGLLLKFGAPRGRCCRYRRVPLFKWKGWPIAIV